MRVRLASLQGDHVRHGIRSGGSAASRDGFGEGQRLCLLKLDPVATEVAA
jgi:hypothetical protein